MLLSHGAEAAFEIKIADYTGNHGQERGTLSAPFYLSY